MPSSRTTPPERHFRTTVYGPTVPLGTADRAARLIEAIPQGDDPGGLYYQPATRGVRAYTFYRHGDDPRWLDTGSSSRVSLSPSLFVVDPEGATRALPLASDRWAVSADGSRAAFAFGWYDDDHEFTAGRGHVDCRVDIWDVLAGATVTSVDLPTVPALVAFVGPNVLIQLEYGSRVVWEPGRGLRTPTPDEHGLPIPGLERVDVSPDWWDGQMVLPGGAGARIPVLLPPAFAALPMAGDRLFVPASYGGRTADIPEKNTPVWLDTRGSPAVPASSGEWTDLMGVDLATLPLVWSPSATCFATGPEDERRVVERGSGRTLYTPPSPWIKAISDDGARAVVALGDSVDYALVSRDGPIIPLRTGGIPKFAFSRAGDRLFVSEDWNRESRRGTPARCFDARTGEVLWETALPTGYLRSTGGAVWSGDDREILVGVWQAPLGCQGGLLALERDDGAIRSRVSLGDFLPYPVAAPRDAILVRAEGLFLAIR